MFEGVQIGSYRVVRKLGEGGMGLVWMAEHVMLGRRAALKTLHPKYSAQADLVTRFFNEARAAALVSDPGIVQIFDFGFHVDGTAYIAMELLQGETLDQRLARQQRLTLVDALRIVRQLATSLAAAHDSGIVHRDLKPENVMLVRDAEVPGGERAKILDFGIAKLVDAGGVKTQTSVVLGTPTYMSPEQCRGTGQVDHRSDLYSLGCVLFSLLAGRPPFVAEGPGEVLSMHLREVPPSLSSVVSGVPQEVEGLVARCLHKDPAQRFSSGAQLAAELELLLQQAAPQTWISAAWPVALSAPDARWFDASSSTTLAKSAGETNPVSGRRGRILWSGLTALVLGLAGIGSWLAKEEDAGVVAKPESQVEQARASGSEVPAAQVASESEVTVAPPAPRADPPPLPPEGPQGAEAAEISKEMPEGDASAASEDSGASVKEDHECQELARKLRWDRLERCAKRLPESSHRSARKWLALAAFEKPQQELYEQFLAAKARKDLKAMQSLSWRVAYTSVYARRMTEDIQAVHTLIDEKLRLAKAAANEGRCSELGDIVQELTLYDEQIARQVSQVAQQTCGAKSRAQACEQATVADAKVVRAIELFNRSPGEATTFVKSLLRSGDACISRAVSGDPRRRFVQLLQLGLLSSCSAAQRAEVSFFISLATETKQPIPEACQAFRDTR